MTPHQRDIQARIPTPQQTTAREALERLLERQRVMRDTTDELLERLTAGRYARTK
jgi:predicted transcriptional regulator